MMLKSKTDSSFGFQVDQPPENPFEWDEEILQSMVIQFGEKSAESSLRFAETND